LQKLRISPTIAREIYEYSLKIGVLNDFKDKLEKLFS
jgi:hypothetical protein